MIEFFKRNAFLLSISAILLVLILISSLRWSNPARLRQIDQIFHAAAAPFQNSANKLQIKASHWSKQYLLLVGVQKENTRLQQQVAHLESELNRYIDDANRFNLLKKQLRFSKALSSRKVFAEVVGKSADGFHQILIINKGSRAGIRRNHAVIVMEGLVGRIFSTSANRSVVQLLTDSRHRFPATIQITRTPSSSQPNSSAYIERTLVVGYRRESIRADRIPSLADIRQGDRVITNGLAGIFPRGIAVGVLKRVVKPKHDAFQYAEITPHVNFNSLQGVFVLLRPVRKNPPIR